MQVTQFPQRIGLLVCLILANHSGQAGEPVTPTPKGTATPHVKTKAPATFIKKPAVTKLKNGSYEFSFSVKTYCDATIAVVDQNGRVVRHLAAGVLGENAPSPFKKKSLKQTLHWDGKDDQGREVSEPAKHRLKVMLGLKPEFKRMLCSAVPGVGSRGPVGMAVDAKGVLYILEGDLWVGALSQAAVIQVLSVKAFDREGNYARTLMPFRADWPPEKVSEVDFVTTTDGRRIPLSGSSNHRPYSGFTRSAPGTTRSIPVITSDGRLIYSCGLRPLSGLRRLISIGTDGSAPRDRYEGPPLQDKASQGANIFMALSPDEKYIYFGGAITKLDRRARKTKICHAIYRVTLDQKEVAKPFIGTEFEKGTGEGQFNDPRGVAVDTQGRIFVCDYMNDRIQVFDANGKFIKAMNVVGPEQIKVHPKTGAIYVLSVRDRGKTTNYGKQARWEVYNDKSLIKFASMDDFKKVAEIQLPKRNRYMHDAPPIVVLDANAEKPILWIANTGHQKVDDMLWKVVDEGAELKKVTHKVPRLKRHNYRNPPLAVDRRNNECYAFNTVQGHVKIKPSGEITKLTLVGEQGKAAQQIVGAAAVGPNGLLYIRSAKMLAKNERIWHIRRFDRKGVLVPFKEAGPFMITNGKQAGTPFNEQSTPFAVGPKGNLYVVGAYSRDGRNCRMDLYDPEGKLLKPNFISMTRSGGCVRVNIQGQLFASDTVRPKGKPFPDMYASDPHKHYFKWYGTVFLYKPEGGGLVDAKPSSATYLAGAIHRELKPVQMKGTQWGFYGISPMPLKTGCQCVMADFDADDWGRIWVPDAAGYCVAVLDSAGNLITRFGSYGNHDALGAGSAVPVPPIPFWSPERVAVLDADAFVTDTLNNRMVQVGLSSEASEEVSLP